jgi:NAD(P)-dependent dehydrogenase (short-subunit alcohol dehydrogenase family)
MNSLFDLSGRVVVVAGGAGYLASVSCRALAQHGATVVIADLNEERLATAVESIRSEIPGARVKGVRFDAGEEASIRALTDSTLQDFGRLDGWVVATFFSIGKRVDDLTAEEFDKANHLNITSTFLMARMAANAMPAGGSVVLFGSMYGLVSPVPQVYQPPMIPNPIEYGANKAGIIQMARYLAAHYGPRNIRVNAVAPGPFPTPQVEEANPAFISRLAERTMLGRIGRQDELAGTVVYLLSDASSYVTGHCLRVDGGWTAW